MWPLLIYGIGLIGGFLVVIVGIETHRKLIVAAGMLVACGGTVFFEYYIFSDAWR